jgi:hypothetical protein
MARKPPSMMIPEPVRYPASASVSTTEHRSCRQFLLAPLAFGR